MAALSPTSYPPPLSTPNSVKSNSDRKQLQLPADRRTLEGQCSFLLQSCSSFSSISQIHAYIIRKSLQQNNFLAARLVSSCFSLGCYSYASRIFGLLLHPDTFLFNAMIKGYVSAGFHLQALLLYCTMLHRGSIPNQFTFPLVLKACSKLDAAETGRALHGHVLKLGHNLDIFTQTALLDLYGSCRNSAEACRLFDRMLERDVAAWNAMLSAYVKSGSIILAENLFEVMPVKNVNSWTVVIGGLLNAGDPNRAIAAFHQMQLHGLKPDKMAIVMALSAISHLGCLGSGKWVHQYITKNKIPIDAFIGTALIDMYSKSGSIQDAKSVFCSMTSKNTSCYNAIISGLGAHGLGKEAIQVFSEMRRKEVKIDDVTVIAVLTACSHSGLIEEGLRCFETIRKECAIDPKMKHYGCTVDMLGRAGRFAEATEILGSIEADSIIIGTLATSCSMHGNVGLASKLAEKMSNLDPENSGFLVWRSKLFAANDEWGEAARIRSLMKERGIEKGVGCSWIEVGGKVHSFASADYSHPCSKAIYRELNRLHNAIKPSLPLEMEDYKQHDFQL